MIRENAERRLRRMARWKKIHAFRKHLQKLVEAEQMVRASEVEEILQLIEDDMADE